MCTRRFGPGFVKPTAWAALAPLHPHRSVVPPVSIAPCSGGALPLAGLRRVASRRTSKPGSFGTAEQPADPIIARPAVGESEAAVRRAGEAPAEALDAAPTVASSTMGTLTVFPVSPTAKTSMPDVAVWSSRALDPNAHRAADRRARHVRKRPPVARAHRALDGPLRNFFITVADRELILPTSLTKRLVTRRGLAVPVLTPRGFYRRSRR